MALNRKQQKFVQEYLEDSNGAQAAIRAGYSKKTAKEQAAHLLTKINISEAIDAARAKHANKAEITLQNVLREYASVGFSSISDYLDFDGSGVFLKDSKTLSKKLLAAVSEVSQVETKTGTTIKFKLHNKIASLDSICKVLGFNAPEKGSSNSEEIIKSLLTLVRLAGDNQ